MTSPLHRFVAESELLRGLDDATREQVMAELQVVTLRGGQLLFHQGEIGDCLYIVAHGRLRVTREREDGTPEFVGEAGRGETVGEMALLSNEPRSATIRAARDSELYRLSASAFNRLLERSPQVTMQLARQIVTRYVGAMRGGGTRPVSSSIALTPMHRDTPLSLVSHRLERALSAIGSVARLNSDVVDAALGPEAAQLPPDHARAGELLSWLYEQESAHQFVIYEADLVPSVWSQRCVRHGDRHLVVASADDGVDGGAAEGNLFRAGTYAPGTRTELLLLHRQSKPVYRGTAAWLARREVSAVHHVALDSEADMERVARFVTGTATGVVLGGGGARSFAHIGVLRAIEEAGVPIDAIGGASMGAYIAAQYALGWDTERMRAYNRETWRRVRPMQDYTVPLLSVLAGRGFRRIARDVCGDAAIEDLARRFFCVSTNLTRASVHVHQHRGSLWRAILASISVPGLLPPVCEEGSLLVDGAILDNVPIDAMRAMCQGTVIAIDVSPAEDLAIDPEVRLSAPGWLTLLRMRRATNGRKFPSIVDVLLRVSTVSSAMTTAAMIKRASLYLRPPTGSFTVVDWKRVDEMIDAGYEYARPALRDWLSRDVDGSSGRRRATQWVPTVEGSVT
jgi:predicted acylesterase/phospholipase RssA/CRP-like cAMP-binding protein